MILHLVNSFYKIMANTFKFFSNIAFKVAPLAVLPFVVSKPQAFWGSKLKQNKMDNRIFTSVLESNLPCEDRKDVFQLNSI